MITARKCRQCGKGFDSHKSNKLYCSRTCFRKDYYKRNKELMRLHRYPSFICPHCNNTIPLTFHPMEDPERWEALVCPYCMLNRFQEIGIIPKTTIVTITTTQTYTSI